MSCMSSSTTHTLCSILLSSCCAGSAVFFQWSRMLRQNGILMRRFAEVGEEGDLVCVGTTKSIKPCHRLVWSTGIGTQEAEKFLACVSLLYRSSRLCFGSVRVANNFRIRSNNELYELLNNIYVVQHIVIQLLPWLVFGGPDFLRNLSWQFYLFSEFSPEICWEEIAEKIIFVFYFDVWPGAQTLALRLISQNTIY